MAKLITNNWKKLLIILGAICILILLYQKIVIKPNIVNDYLDSDIYVESDIFDSVQNGAGQISDKVEDDIANNPVTSESDNTMQNVIKWAVIIGIIFLAIMLLDSLLQGSGDAKSKK